MSTPDRRRVRASAAAGLAVCAAALTGTSAASARAGDLLPNLVQVAPGQVSVQSPVVRGRRVHRLGFASATENRGAGPLTVYGSRASESVPTMQVAQLVAREDGSERRVRDVGLMRYVVHRDHQHWHLIKFASYELRPAGKKRRGRGDRKTGFCLGDRYRISSAGSLAGFDPFPEHTGRCGLRRPDLLEMLEGISVGYGDNYFAHVEGQYVDVTGLPAGRYRLIHTANPTRALLETSYRDNASSALLRLSWPRGRQRAPRVRVLRRCDARERCS